MRAPYLETLERAAEEAQTRETAYRREAAKAIAALDRERAFAFRKLNLMRAVADAVAGAEEEAAAVESVRELLCGRLGWSGDSDSRRAVFDRFASVTRAALACRGSGDDMSAATVVKALDAFETWYRERHGVPFWTLFEQEMPETPLVDF